MKIPLISRIKLSKTWMIFGVAASIGLLASLIARNYLSERMAAIEQHTAGEAIKIVVARRDLQKGERISTETVAVRNFPKDYVHSLAITPESFNSVEGEAVAYPARSGEPILWSMLEMKKAPTFSSKVEAGRRAITVPVDEINSISGLLEPGDVIDLIVTIDRNGKKLTFPLLQGVQVMATGQRSIDDPASGEARQYSTVTLDTTPEQAQHVIAARENGTLTALLRNPDDKKPFARNSDINILLGYLPQRGGTTRNVRREIPILYGGGGNESSQGDMRLRTEVREPSSGNPPDQTSHP